MIDEALAEETQRGERRKNRCDKTTAAILEPEPAAPAAQDLRESPIEPNPNPKRRLLVKSASSTGSGSGQQSAERPAEILNQECKLETRWKWVLVKARHCLEHRQQIQDEE